MLDRASIFGSTTVTFGNVKSPSCTQEFSVIAIIKRDKML